MKMQGGVGTQNGYGTIERSSDGSLSHWRVIIFAALLCMATFAEGYDIGVLNGVIIRVKEQLNASSLEISTLVSLTPLFIIFGAPFGGVLADRVGRRRGLMCTCVVLVLGPMIMALAPNVLWLAIGRGGVGFGIGMGYVIVSMYLTEIAPMELRGRLLIGEEFALNIGVFCGFIMNLLLLGTQNDWRWMLGLGVLPALFLLIGLCVPNFPESPRWLCMQSRFDEASTVLKTFLSAEEAAVALKSMQLAQQQSEQQQGQDQEANVSSSQCCAWLELICSKKRFVQRATLSSLVVAIAQSSCGLLIVGYYSSELLSTAMSKEAAFRATIFIGGVRLTVLLVVLGLLERVGRRPMLLASTAVTIVACAWIMCSFLYDLGPTSHILGFGLMAAGFSLGQGPIVFVYISEVFVTEIRGTGVGFAMVVSRLVGALSTFLFPAVVESTSISHAFLLQAMWNSAILVALWSVVVETHGRALEDMAAAFQDKA